LDARTTLIFLIIGHREIILGHEELSRVIHTIYQCILLLFLIVPKRIIFAKQLLVKIGDITLQ
jgi:hypothetical protein